MPVIDASVLVDASSESVHTAMRRAPSCATRRSSRCLPSSRQRRRPPCGLVRRGALDPVRAATAVAQITPFGHPVPIRTARRPSMAASGQHHGVRRVVRRPSGMALHGSCHPRQATAAGDRTPLSSADPRLSRGTRASTPASGCIDVAGRPKTSAALTAMRRSFRRSPIHARSGRNECSSGWGACEPTAFDLAVSTLSSSESAEPPSAVGRRGNSSSTKLS